MADDTWTTAYDTLLPDLITRASRALDRYVNRKPGAFAVTTDVTLYFDGSGCETLWIGELATTPTSVAVAEGGVVDTVGGTGGTYTAYTTTDYRPWPYNAPDTGRPYLRLDLDPINGTKGAWYKLKKAVKVVGKFGYSTGAPEDVVQATIIQTVRWFQRGKQAFRDTGAISDLGQLQYVKALDPDVKLMVDYLKEIEL